MRAYLALVRYALRVGRPKRVVVALVPTAVMALLGLLVRSAETDHARGAYFLVAHALLSLVLPLVALGVADAILPAEIRHGSYTLTWLSPVRHELAVAGRWTGGMGVVAAELVPAAVVGSVLAGNGSQSVAAATAAVLGGAAYLALFVLIGATFKRPVAWALGFVIVVERFLGTALPGVASLTPSWLSQGYFSAAVDQGARKGVPSGGSAVAWLVVMTVVLILVAGRAVRRLRTLSAAD